jgi:sarcosine oxidase
MPAAAAFDVAVVGLGAVGSATCHHLAKAGVRVVGIDRFHPPHDQGSSHGLTRITRLALGEGEAFVPLARRSHELWRELEDASGEQGLYRRTGGLLISSPSADARSYHGNLSFFERTVSLATKHAIAHERLDARALRERFPQFQVRDDEHGYLERDAGVLAPERIVAAQLAMAARHGAQLRYGEPVLELRPQGLGGVEIVTPRGRVVAARVVLTAGPWVRDFDGSVPSGLLRVHRQVLHWFALAEPDLFAPARCPVWMWLHGLGHEGSMYGFPTGDGVDGVKVATEHYGEDIHPDAVERRVSEAESRAMHAQHIEGRLRGVLPQVVRTATCLYTCTDDASFVQRRHDASEAITVVSACSGHGFKHSAALGERIALDLAR